MMELAGKDIKTAIKTMFTCFKENMTRVRREMKDIKTKSNGIFGDEKYSISSKFFKNHWLGLPTN